MRCEAYTYYIIEAIGLLIIFMIVGIIAHKKAKAAWYIENEKQAVTRAN